MSPPILSSELGTGCVSNSGTGGEVVWTSLGCGPGKRVDSSLSVISTPTFRFLLFGECEILLGIISAFSWAALLDERTSIGVSG